MPADLAELVAAARDGDRAGLRRAGARHLRRHVHAALRLTGDEEDARDVVQESYLRAYRGLKRFRGDAQFSHLAVPDHRQLRVDLPGQRASTATTSSTDDAPVADDRPDADPEARPTPARPARPPRTRPLRRLPPRLRAVVVLRDVYDLPHEAIAAELGISESAAKVRLHRARRKLRETAASPRAADDGRGRGDAHAV